MTSVSLQLLISRPSAPSDYRKDSRDGGRASYSPTPQERSITLRPVAKRRRESRTVRAGDVAASTVADLMAFLPDQLADREIYTQPKVGPDQFVPDRTGRLVTRCTLRCHHAPVPCLPLEVTWRDIRAITGHRVRRGVVLILSAFRRPEAPLSCSVATDVSGLCH